MNITYTFHEISALLEKCHELGYEPRLEMSFMNRYDYYIISYKDKFCLQRSGKEDDRSRPFYYDTFDELANDGSLDELYLKWEWHDIDFMSCPEFDACDLWNDICRNVYYQGEEDAERYVEKEIFPGIKSLRDLFLTLVKCYRRRTCKPEYQAIWREDDPTIGHSDLAALMVNDMFGGTIRHINVRGEDHYFNEIDGSVVDLTIDRFDTAYIHIEFEPNELIDRDELLAQDGVRERYEALLENVKRYLSIVG